MRRAWLLVIQLLIGTVLSACGATMPATSTGDASTSAAGDTSAPVSSAVATTQSLPAGPVTPIMAKLRLSGEAYAAEGDPQAPITVVEFSDYG